MTRCAICGTTDGPLTFVAPLLPRGDFYCATHLGATAASPLPAPAGAGTPGLDALMDAALAEAFKMGRAHQWQNDYPRPARAALAARLSEADAGWTAASAALAHEQELAEVRRYKIEQVQEVSAGLQRRAEAADAARVAADGDAALLDRTYQLTAHGQSLPLTGRQLLTNMAFGEDLAASRAGGATDGR